MFVKAIGRIMRNDEMFVPGDIVSVPDAEGKRLISTGIARPVKRTVQLVLPVGESKRHEKK